MLQLSKIRKILLQRFLNVLIQHGKLCFLFVICSTSISIVLLCLKIELYSDNFKSTTVWYNNYKNLKLNNQHPEMFSPTTPTRKVTKSLSEMMKTVPEVNEDIILFNSVPKSGSEVIVLLLQWLENVNGFKHVRLPTGRKHRLSRYEQDKLIQVMMNEVRDGALPFTFDRHVYFINFTSFGHQSPTYMSFIRDPIDKAIARFYYHEVTPVPQYRNKSNKLGKTLPWKTKLHYGIVNEFEKCVKNNERRCTYKNGEFYDLSIPYFCGHEEQCMVHNDKWALNRAKQNVERYYPVVGLLEDVNSTLIVLQQQLPHFFKNVLNIFNTHLSEKNRVRELYWPTNILNLEVRRILEEQLTTEYEFYHYIKKRLLNQRATV